MHRLPLILLMLFLAAPTAALAARKGPNDGTLTVRNGAGTLQLEFSGAAIGRLDRGHLEVVSPVRESCDALDVWGPVRVKSRVRLAGPTTCVFSRMPGRNPRVPIRFRLVLEDVESLTIRDAVGLQLSAVGRGRGAIRGTGRMDGVYSLNGARFRSLPNAGLRFTLGATLP